MADPIPHPTTSLEHAQALGALGLRVLPIKPGHKRPPMASWQHAATDEADKIDAWYRGLYRDAGVGLALGPQPNGSYLFAIDIDTHDPAHNGWEALADLEAEHGTLPDTWRSLTGAGGAHLIFAAPPGVTVRNQQASGNRIAAGIDVRGDGGQIVVAPTVHPDTQRTYEWEAGFAPWEHVVARAPRWLLELVREPDPEPVAEPTSSLPRDDSLFDAHRADWDWRAELARRGWQLTIPQPRGNDSHWTRPGKDPRKGNSGVLHEPDGPFVIFTTEMPETWAQAGKRTRDGSGYAFGPFAFYAATEHAGDRSQAARTLADRYGAPDVDLGALIAVQEASEVVQEDDDHDWKPRDVAGIYHGLLDGTYEPETPHHLYVDGGLPLLYPGRVHSLFGEPGGGKTWIGYKTVAERLQAGESVLFIDWEDSPRGAAQRLLQLGVTLEQLERFTYINPSTGLSTGWEYLKDDIGKWSLIVIDSTGESMAASGIDPNADGQVATWVAFAKLFARGGATVLLIDHVAKNVDNRDMEIGSQRKQAGITGASYRVDTISSPAKGKAGKLKLVTRKDRLGNRAKGSTAAEVDIHDTDDGRVEITLHVSDAQAAAERGERFRPTVLMERVSRWLEIHPGASKSTIRKEVQGKAAAVDTALDVLIEEGYVVVVKDGQSHVHTVVKDYREEADTLGELVDNSNRVPVSHRVPTVSPESRDMAETDRVPRVPGGHIPGTRDTVQGVEDVPTVSPTLGPVDFFAETNPNRNTDDFLF